MRSVAVLARPGDAAACPAGVAAGEFGAALLDDACEVVAALEAVRPAVVVCPPGRLASDDLPVWPGTVVLHLPLAEVVISTLDGLAAVGAEAAVVLVGDAPDLPGMLVGKLFRALGRADCAVCPAAGGGLVAVGSQLPVADWLRAAAPDVDDASALAALRAAAPERRNFAVGPGWRRLRTPADLARLDPGLEGWAATRALLAADRRGR